MRHIRIVRRSAWIGVLTATLLGLGTATVSAHYMEVLHGSDRAWVDSTHDHLNVEDRECDGNAVYGQGYWWDSTIGSSRLVTVQDSNGCASGWGHGDGVNFYQFRICEASAGCSAWTSVS